MNQVAGVAPALILMGPTASGKTEAALALAQHLPVDIISVDSAMVYRGMDIGTAKPEVAVRERVPHRLVDIRDPDQPYSAAQFRADALAAMAAIRAAARIPLLVGGTMLYFQALLRGLSNLPAADTGLRARLTAEAEAQGWAALHARLARVDPAAAQRIHPNDPQRIQRALEVYELTGRPLSELQRRASEPDLFPFRAVKLVLTTDRSRLAERIQSRFCAMLERGLVAEVQALRARYHLTADLPSMRAVGYRQVWAYLEGRLSRAELVERAASATRQLAKRQWTWLRRESQTLWFDAEKPQLVNNLLNSIKESGING